MFWLATGGRTRGHILEAREQKFSRVDVKKLSFANKGVAIGLWNSLPEEVVSACSVINAFKNRLYRVAPQKTEQSIQSIFLGLCSQINSYLFFTLLDRASFLHYINTKIIKFGWELFILWVQYFLLFYEYCTYRCVSAQSVERPPHNREVVGSIPGRVIPKDVKRWELMLPCLALNIWKG